MHGKEPIAVSVLPEPAELRRNAEERARLNSRTLARHIVAAGIVPVAEHAGIGKSTVASWFNEHRDELGKALAYMGLKVVPTSKRCYNPRRVGAIFELAKAYMEIVGESDDADDVLGEDGE